MKQLRILIGLAILPLWSSASTVDYAVLLSAIADVETGSNPRKVGKAGERSAYQIARVVWRQHTDLPFSKANDPEVAKEVAIKHLSWLEREIKRKGYEITAERMALCWNAGLTRGLSGKAFPSSVDYASRVKNLYEDKVESLQP